jgi:BirA family biotin operon repressor/biotin-[acetyl-CoA-carboxylase] ligase
VEALRRSGLDIEGIPSGYRLRGDPDVVAAPLVEPRLEPPLGGPVIWHAAIGSTNDQAAQRAREGAPEGLVVGADHQTAGKGRRGRLWEDLPGDALMFSVVLRPPIAPADAGILPLVVAVGLADALSPLTERRVEIAWPNDIVVDGRKLAGILVELAADHDRIRWAVVGMGINVRSSPDLPASRWTPGSLAALGVSVARADLLVAVLGGLSRRYRALLSDGPGEVLDAYSRRDLLAGRTVTVSLEDGYVAGAGNGIDALGRLRLLTSEGERRIAAGEVVRVDGDHHPEG